jgi:tetratricopeptide (TPR) repeat protein
VLEGSVTRSGNKLRISAQLNNVADGYHLWAATYDREMTDIFEIRSDISRRVADALKLQLGVEEKQRLEKKPTESPEAHELYLKGRFFWNKRTGADLKKAIQYFEQAIGKDPNYALAYAGLADAYVLFTNFTVAAPSESFPRAEAAARKALELDDSLAEAHTSLGQVLWEYYLDATGATKEFERAIALNPNYATAHHWYGVGPPEILGDFEKSIAEINRALQLDPLSLIINADFGGSLITMRRYDEAIAQLRKTLEMDPRFYYAHWQLGVALQLKGQLDEAIAEYKKAAELDDDPYVVGLLAQAYARAGQRDQALKLLAQLQQMATRRWVPSYTFAIVHTAFGEKDRAIDYLERAYRERDLSDLSYIRFDASLDPLRGDPRFEALARTILAKQ